MKDQMSKKLEIIRNQWLFDCRWILPKEKIRKILCKLFKLKQWHVAPLNAKPYAMYALKAISKYAEKNNSEATYVEIGCGLGDIIGNLNVAGHKIGIDLAENTIHCARLIHPHTEFRVGTFDEVNVGDIDVLILLNFLHGISKNTVKRDMESLLNRNHVKMICFDSFLREGDDYYNNHQGRDFLGDSYSCISKSRGFSTGVNRRYIEIWKKNE